MRLVFKSLVFFFCIMTSCLNAKESFINEARDLFEKKNYEEAKFLFQRNIVFNPKNSESYVYLAKIFNIEENESEEEKNLNTALLLEPDNEEAMYMLIDVKLKKSDFEQVKKLRNDFEVICKTLCSKVKSIDERLINIEAKNES